MNAKNFGVSMPENGVPFSESRYTISYASYPAWCSFSRGSLDGATLEIYKMLRYLSGLLSLR